MKLFGIELGKKPSATEPDLVNQTFEQEPPTLAKGNHPTWCTQVEYDMLCARRNIEVFRSMGYKYSTPATDDRADKAHWILKHLLKISGHPSSEIRRVYLFWRADTSIGIAVWQDDDENFLDTSKKRKMVIDISADGIVANQLEYNEHYGRVLTTSVPVTNNTVEFDMLHWISRKGN
jgi:hypothetical protein